MTTMTKEQMQAMAQLNRLGVRQLKVSMGPIGSGADIQLDTEELAILRGLLERRLPAPGGGLLPAVCNTSGKLEALRTLLMAMEHRLEGIRQENEGMQQAGAR